MLNPRFGDGVDAVIGGGLDGVITAAKQAGLAFPGAIRDAGFEMADSLDTISQTARRVIVLLPGDFDLEAGVRRAIDVLSRNPKGFFLMVESDLHTEEIMRGLERTVRLDRAIRATAERLGEDTLILFTADHSYDLRVHDGRRGMPLLPELDPDFGDDQDSIRLDNVRREDDHTGEEVIVAARTWFGERERRHVQRRPLRDHARSLWMALSVHSWSSSRTIPQFNSKNRSGHEESRV